MKRLVSFFSCFIIFCTCTHGQVTKTDDGKMKVKMTDDKMKVKDKSGMGNMMSPYTASYSSDFKMGNPAHSKMILEIWKDYDDNMFDRHASWFADTLQIITADGTVTKGMAANMEGVKKWRSSLTSAKSTVDAWMPLRSTDKNEDWVAIWGTEMDTYPDGHTTSMEVHEIWRINKDGKVDYMKQYQGKSPGKL